MNQNIQGNFAICISVPLIKYPTQRESNVEIIWKYFQTREIIFTQLKAKNKNVKDKKITEKNIGNEKNMKIMLHFLRMKTSYPQGDTKNMIQTKICDK